MNPSPEQPDRFLIERSKSGDLGAFEALARKFQGLVFRFLFHFLGSASDAEDLTQETFLIVYRKLSQHDSAHSFPAWLMAIARNLAISYKRKNIPFPLDPAVIASVIKDVCPAPERELLMKEAAQEVHDSLAKLPEIHREILVMRYLLDLPLNEVALLLNIPEGTAKSRLFKAWNELKELLESYRPAEIPLGL
ncbi:hypothetical protein AUK22_03870 [bacterium CG2_30_54_10]|nr:MAG: hypothetical protein AUK22_03870 [bacterium CG2_30_54_10]